jgi:hypothetical protein
MTRSRVSGAVLVVIGLLLGACSPFKGMREVPTEQISFVPPADQAAIVFMRGRTGGAISTSLFELRQPPDRFVGILVAESRLMYLTAPGRTRFMVVGHSASFMDADLAAGKTYNVGIVPGDLGEELFVLRPLRDADLGQRDAQQCARACPWLVNTPKSEDWARRQASSIQRKKERYLPEWERRANRATLLATDGR